jgi:ketosteroid isomerase-like protein
MATRDLVREQANKDLVRAAFDAWAAGTGGPLEMLAEDATWTIVGNCPVSRTYHSRQEFLDVVRHPFNARMSAPMRPTVRAVYADGDWVIVLFDGTATVRDGTTYSNTYTWYLRLQEDAIVEAIAFFDTITFTELWNRVTPADGSATRAEP